MSSRVFYEFNNLIEVANSYKQYTDYYYFIKYHAFKYAYNSINQMNEMERNLFENMMTEYKQERANANLTKNITKEDYVNFLEYFFKNIDFDNSTLKMIETCKQLVLIMQEFGEIEELWVRRIDYFNKKISLLQPQIIEKPQIKAPNKIEDERQVYKKVSTSLEELNLPNVKDKESNIQPVILNFGDYIPRLVDQSIKLPITKSSPLYPKVKDLIRTHMEYSGLELDFHKLELAKDHVEAAIYYLRNIE